MPKNTAKEFGNIVFGPSPEDKQHNMSPIRQGCPAVCHIETHGLPPRWLLLTVFLWRGLVGHKAGNLVFAVALGEGVQQGHPGLLIVLRPWRKTLRVTFKHAVKPFSSKFPSSVEIILCMPCKRKGTGILMKSLQQEKKMEHKGKSCMWFVSVAGSQTSVQIINWVQRHGEALKETRKNILVSFLQYYSFIFCNRIFIDEYLLHCHFNAENWMHFLK